MIRLEANLRIIAGMAKGRRFRAPEGMDTRPTLDRVKEAMFGAVQFDLPGSRVLDLFSGSGNLGLEAASRGASFVLCNDRSAKCVSIIRDNAASLGLSDRVQVTNRDYRMLLDELAGRDAPFDIVFIDAPYYDGTAQDAAERIFGSGTLLRSGGYILLEHSPDLPPVERTGVMRIAWTHHYGNCCVSMLKGE